MQARHEYYIKRINKTLDYIDNNLDKSFSLEELSQISNFSKYHFHRLFSSIVKESPFEYILRLRLEKAATMISSDPNKNLSVIANKCGFTDLSIFSRNFKKYFNVPPSSFKKGEIKKSNLSQINSKDQQAKDVITPYFCPKSKTIKWTSTMEIIKNIEVKSIPEIVVAYNRSLGPYKGNNELYQKHRNELFAWAASKGLMNDENFKYLIMYHDNPNVALNDTQRMSLCVTIPEQIETEGKIGKMSIKEGQYLVCSCEITAPDFPKIWEWIYGQWFPQNNYIPDDKPYFELYPEQPKGELFKVEFYIPVKIA